MHLSWIKSLQLLREKFNDGTRIKFINNPNNDTEIVSNVSPNCEGYYRDKFNIQQHDTPGIHQNKDNCDQYGTIERSKLRIYLKVIK